MIVEICGYRGTGKDYLFEQFNGNKEFNWKIYHNPKSPKPFPKDHQHCIKVALAYELKKSVMVKIVFGVHKLSVDLDWLDLHKDQKIFDGKSFRDFCIEEATAARKIDENIWCKLSPLSSYDPMTGETYFLTDFRHWNEHRYCVEIADEITSIRVFNSEIPIPPKEINSEHNLDYFLTDFLLLRKEEDFIRAVELFPQYKNYVPLN